MKQFMKKALFREEGDGIYRIRWGVGKGLRMKIDIQNKAQRVMGLDEQEIMSTFSEYSENCGYFIDIGASDGFYALLYRKLNPSGSIFLFEPKSQFRALQKENFRLNNFEPNFYTSQKFVGSVDDDRHVRVASVIPESGKTIFFKVDVDGGELEVLKGLEELLANNQCYFIIETHSKELEELCIAFLQERGFQTKIIRNAKWRKILPEKRIIDHNRWFVAKPEL